MELLYRLPWRDNTISVASITQIQLQRHVYFYHGTMAEHYYRLTIDHGGISTQVTGETKPYYEEQLIGAYQDIQANLDASAAKGKKNKDKE